MAVRQAVVVLAMACCASGHLRAARSPGWMEKRAGGMFGDFVMHGETVDRVASPELYGGLPPRFQATAAQTGRVAPDSYADVVLSEGGAVGDKDTAARAGGDADATESDPYGSLLTGLHANHPRHAKELLAEDKARKEAFVVEAAEDKAATAHGKAAQTSATMRKEAKEAFVHEASEDKTASSALAAFASSPRGLVEATAAGTSTSSRSDGGAVPANSGTSKNEGKELDTAMKSAGAALDSATATLQSGGNQQTSDSAAPAANTAAAPAASGGAASGSAASGSAASGSAPAAATAAAPAAGAATTTAPATTAAPAAGGGGGGGGLTVVQISGKINKEAHDKFVADMKAVPSDQKTIPVYVDSKGGSVQYGKKIVDVMKSYESNGKTIATVCMSHVGSIATYIFIMGTTGSRYVVSVYVTRSVNRPVTIL